MSPALAGRFFTTEPPGKHYQFVTDDSKVRNYLIGLAKTFVQVNLNKHFGQPNT